MSDRLLFAVVATLIATATLAPQARSACNAIPDAESASIGAEAVLAAQNPATAVTPPAPGLIGFKGALGRMDHIALLPGYTTSFRIQPDGRCVDAVEGKLVVRDVGGNEPLESSGLVVSLLTKSAGGGKPHALVLGGEHVCSLLAALGQSHQQETGVVMDCNKDLPPVLEGSNVRVRLPDDGKLLTVAGTPLRGSATVIVTRGLADAAKHAALLSTIAAGGCAANCSALRLGGAVACVDRFYAVLASGTVVSDPVPCAVTVPVAVATNDFKEKCEDLPSPDPTLVQCEDKRTVLQLWEDDCGGVHIPFNWADISKDTSSNKITRVVDGRSPTSRTEEGVITSKRIWIPGREFLGSTPVNDPQGTAATTDWRRPDIDVWYPPDSPQEVGLRGSVDEPNSIVHVFPRMPVSLACDGVAGDEGCMGVEGGGGISCACRDRYPAGCTCRPLAPPKFFACDGGDYDGMPCTRHAHCNSAPGSTHPNGTCSRQPTCQLDGKNGVWESPGPPPVGTACWDDDACKRVSNRPWCGYRLFDIHDRIEPLQPPLIELDADIATGGRARRGVCSKKRDKVCNQNSGSGCNAATEGECRGYTTRAEGKKP